MKILDLKVKNFAPIMVAMKRKELAIDFRRGDNLLTLLVGGNGTGKTTLCSLLHPFAYNGDIDNRDNDIIMKDMDGYKSITISNGDDVYYIEHFYKRNNDSSLSVKSFVKLNGEELNPNGNVTSFKAVIQNYLGIDESYLKLTRLGANVINLINMNSSERKEFMNKRLEELNRYGKLYKKVSEDLRLIKALLKINVNNMNRLNISNIELYKKEITVLSDKKEMLNMNKSDIENQISFTRGRLTNLLYDDIESEVEKVKKERDALMADLEKDRLRIDSSLMDIDADVIFKQYKAETEVFNSIMSKLNDLYTGRSRIEALIESYSSAKYVTDMRNRRESLLNDIENYEKTYGTKHIGYNSDDFKTALTIMQIIESNHSNIYSLSKSDIKKVMKECNGNFNYMINSIHSKMAESYNMKEVDKLKGVLKNKNDSLYVIIEPECGFERCSFRKFYKDMNGLIDEGFKDKENDNWEDLLNVVEELDRLKTVFEHNKKVLSNIPNKVCSFDYVIERLSRGESIIDENSLTDMINTLEEYETYISNKAKLFEIEEELSSIRETSDMDKLIISKDKIDIKISNIEKEAEKVKESLLEIELTYNRISEIKEAIASINKTETRIMEINTFINDSNDRLNEISSCKALVANSESLLNKLESDISAIGDKVEKGLIKIEEYNKLSKERCKLDSDYNDWSIVADSIAAKKGIPLDFINYYLESIRVLANDCLRVVYGDSLYISKMHADEKSFDILYVKDGLIAGDIKNASQGESSFINIAISFAFLMNELKDYNIIILDEVDGVLDSEKRSKFIDILHDRLYHMNCEQCFMISHSDIYNNHDIDMIVTDDSDISKYKKMNIIFKQ